MFSRSTNTVVPVVTIHSNFGATETSYVRCQKIHGQGEWAGQIYEVVRGAVRSYKVLSDGRRQICAFHLPNDIFGWENGPAHRFTAEAIVDTSVRVVRRQILEHVATTDVLVIQSLMSMATRNLEHAESQLMLLGRKNSLEKVSAFLLEMDRRLSATGVVALPMSRRDIADYLGLALETVSRELSQLRALGILRFAGAGRRQIVLENRQKLQRLSS